MSEKFITLKGNPQQMEDSGLLEDLTLAGDPEPKGDDKVEIGINVDDGSYWKFSQRFLKAEKGYSYDADNVPGNGNETILTQAQVDRFIADVAKLKSVSDSNNLALLDDPDTPAEKQRPIFGQVMNSLAKNFTPQDMSSVEKFRDAIEREFLKAGGQMFYFWDGDGDLSTVGDVYSLSPEEYVKQASHMQQVLHPYGIRPLYEANPDLGLYKYNVLQIRDGSDETTIFSESGTQKLFVANDLKKYSSEAGVKNPTRDELLKFLIDHPEYFQTTAKTVEELKAQIAQNPDILKDSPLRAAVNEKGEEIFLIAKPQFQTCDDKHDKAGFKSFGAEGTLEETEALMNWLDIPATFDSSNPSERGLCIVLPKGAHLEIAKKDEKYETKILLPKSLLDSRIADVERAIVESKDGKTVKLEESDEPVPMEFAEDLKNALIGFRDGTWSWEDMQNSPFGETILSAWEGINNFANKPVVQLAMIALVLFAGSAFGGIVGGAAGVYFQRKNAAAQARFEGELDQAKRAKAKERDWFTDLGATDMTAEARDGKYEFVYEDPVTLNSMITVFGRNAGKNAGAGKSTNSYFTVAGTGTGKTADYEALAKAMVSNEAGVLNGWRIIKIPLSALVVHGDGKQGGFEAGLLGVYEQAKREGNVIIMWDEVGLLKSTGTHSGRKEGADMEMLQYLDRGIVPTGFVTTDVEFGEKFPLGKRDPIVRRTYLDKRTPPTGERLWGIIQKNAIERHQKINNVTISEAAARQAMTRSQEILESYEPARTIELLNMAVDMVLQERTSAEREKRPALYTEVTPDLVDRIIVREKQKQRDQDLVRLREEVAREAYNASEKLEQMGEKLNYDPAMLEKKGRNDYVYGRGLRRLLKELKDFNRTLDNIETPLAEILAGKSEMEELLKNGGFVAELDSSTPPAKPAEAPKPADAAPPVSPTPPSPPADADGEEIEIDIPLDDVAAPAQVEGDPNAPKGSALKDAVVSYFKTFDAGDDRFDPILGANQEFATAEDYLAYLRKVAANVQFPGQSDGEEKIRELLQEIDPVMGYSQEAVYYVYSTLVGRQRPDKFDQPLKDQIAKVTMIIERLSGEKTEPLSLRTALPAYYAPLVGDKRQAQQILKMVEELPSDDAVVDFLLERAIQVREPRLKGAALPAAKLRMRTLVREQNVDMTDLEEAGYYVTLLIDDKIALDTFSDQGKANIVTQAELLTAITGYEAPVVEEPAPDANNVFAFRGRSDAATAESADAADPVDPVDDGEAANVSDVRIDGTTPSTFTELKARGVELPPELTGLEADLDALGINPGLSDDLVSIRIAVGEEVKAQFEGRYGLQASLFFNSELTMDQHVYFSFQLALLRGEAVQDSERQVGIADLIATLERLQKDEPATWLEQVINDLRAIVPNAPAYEPEVPVIDVADYATDETPLADAPADVDAVASTKVENVPLRGALVSYFSSFNFEDGKLEELLGTSEEFADAGEYLTYLRNQAVSVRYPGDAKGPKNIDKLLKITSSTPPSQRAVGYLLVARFPQDTAPQILGMATRITPIIEILAGERSEPITLREAIPAFFSIAFDDKNDWATRQILQVSSRGSDDEVLDYLLTAAAKRDNPQRTGKELERTKASLKERVERLNSDPLAIAVCYATLIIDSDIEPLTAEALREIPPGEVFGLEGKRGFGDLELAKIANQAEMLRVVTGAPKVEVDQADAEIEVEAEVDLDEAGAAEQSAGRSDVSSRIDEEEVVSHAPDADETGKALAALEPLLRSNAAPAAPAPASPERETASRGVDAADKSPYARFASIPTAEIETYVKDQCGTHIFNALGIDPSDFADTPALLQALEDKAREDTSMAETIDITLKSSGTWEAKDLAVIYASMADGQPVADEEQDADKADDVDSSAELKLDLELLDIPTEGKSWEQLLDDIKAKASGPYGGKALIGRLEKDYKKANPEATTEQVIAFFVPFLKREAITDPIGQKVVRETVEALKALSPSNKAEENERRLKVVEKLSNLLPAPEAPALDVEEDLLSEPTYDEAPAREVVPPAAPVQEESYGGDDASAFDLASAGAAAHANPSAELTQQLGYLDIPVEKQTWNDLLGRVGTLMVNQYGPKVAERLEQEYRAANPAVTTEQFVVFFTSVLKGEVIEDPAGQQAVQAMLGVIKKPKSDPEQEVARQELVAKLQKLVPAPAAPEAPKPSGTPMIVLGAPAAPVAAPPALIDGDPDEAETPQATQPAAARLSPVAPTPRTAGIQAAAPERGPAFASPRAAPSAAVAGVAAAPRVAAVAPGRGPVVAMSAASPGPAAPNGSDIDPVDTSSMTYDDFIRALGLEGTPERILPNKIVQAISMRRAQYPALFKELTRLNKLMSPDAAMGGEDYSDAFPDTDRLIMDVVKARFGTEEDRSRALDYIVLDYWQDMGVEAEDRRAASEQVREIGEESERIREEEKRKIEERSEGK